MAELYTIANTKVYIGGTTAASTKVAFEALTWVEVGGITNLGSFGDEETIVEKAVISNKRVLKAKGSANGGDAELTMVLDSADVGQQALLTAQKSPSSHNFKVVYDDSDTVGTTLYFRAKVANSKYSGGDANTAIERTVKLAIDSEVLEVEKA